MTKKTILGVIGGLLVVCGIGAATGCDIDENNSYPNLNSSIVQSSVTSVQSVDSSSVFSSSAYISSSIAESSISSVQSADSSSVFSSSAYISSSIAESSVTSVQSTYSSSASSSSAVSQPDIIASDNSSASEPVSSVSSNKPSQPSNNTSNHFNDYDIPEQQQTTSYVLNTNTKKFHYPSCSSVKTIKPEHYSTISSRTDAISRGYSPCGRCHP